MGCGTLGSNRSEPLSAGKSQLCASCLAETISRIFMCLEHRSADGNYAGLPLSSAEFRGLGRAQGLGSGRCLMFSQVEPRVSDFN